MADKKQTAKKNTQSPTRTPMLGRGLASSAHNDLQSRQRRLDAAIDSATKKTSK